MEIPVKLETINNLPVWLDISKPYILSYQCHHRNGMQMTVVEGCLKDPYSNYGGDGYYLAGSLEENQKLIDAAIFNHQFQGFLESKDS